MCGILGIITPPGIVPQISDAHLHLMRDTMAARGPDDATSMRRDNVCLAHRRLAIRDLGGGAQPWISDDARFALVYNGELYNDDLLREQLKPQGFEFRTRCDTEVLMAAWQHWGYSCVERLRGMFAFGVYDFQNSELFLARDRLGVKPLFHAKIGDAIVFASSIAAIVEHPEFSRSANFAAVRHYLTTFRITLGRETMFRGIETLLPGETLHHQNGKTHIERYWRAPLGDESSYISYDDAVDTLEQKLTEAVSIRLRSDVPVGMMLSGGVDSSTLACLVNREHGISMTARCGGGISDEMPGDASDFTFAERCAREVGFDFKSIAVDDVAYQTTWLDLIDSYATPVSTPTDVIINRVACDLRQHVGVALGGEGADEACLGYLIPHWSGNDFDLAGTSPSAATRASLQQVYGSDSFASAGSHYLLANGLIPAATQAQIFQDSVWSEAFADGAVENFYDQQFDALGDLPNVLKTANLLLTVNLESLLSRLDSATMAASLESRVPFTDHELVEFVCSLPRAYRIDVDPSCNDPHRAASALAAEGVLRGKRVLRSVAARQMSSELAERPKASFPTPVPTWLGSNWRPWLADRYENSDFAREVFRSEALAEMTALPPHLAIWNWPLANVILWADRWLT